MSPEAEEKLRKSVSGLFAVNRRGPFSKQDYIAEMDKLGIDVVDVDAMFNKVFKDILIEVSEGLYRIDYNEVNRRTESKR